MDRTSLPYNYQGDLTLRGYQSREWMSAIHHYNSDKPDRIARHVLLGLWTLLFQPTWAQHNIIKHGPTSIVAQTQRDAFLLNIHEWKRNAGTRLGAAQIYLADYDDETIQTWSNQQLRRMLDILSRALANYLLTLANPTQPLITSFFLRA